MVLIGLVNDGSTAAATVPLKSAKPEPRDAKVVEGKLVSTGSTNTLKRVVIAGAC